MELVDFVDAENKPIDGLLSIHDFELAESRFERAVLQQAALFQHIDRVFFRRFKDADEKHVRTSQIAAYVVDNSHLHLSEEELATLHHKLWLHGSAPLLYVVWPTRIDILSCAREPDFWANGIAHHREAARVEHPAAESQGTPGSSSSRAIETAAAISTAMDNRRRFSAYRLAEGTFWDDRENQKLAKDEAAAHRTLIQAIVEADRDLDGANRPVLRRLFVLMVLINQWLSELIEMKTTVDGCVWTDQETLQNIWISTQPIRRRKRNPRIDECADA